MCDFPILDDKFLVQERNSKPKRSKQNRFMCTPITNTEIFPFTEPEYSFGQKVKTDDSYIGYIVGLDFYPETGTWSYGVYLLDRKQEVTEEIWYEAEQLQALDSKFNLLFAPLIYSQISSSKKLPFTEPEYTFGQQVKTEDSYIGYIVGIDFYPRTSTWSYGVYLSNPKQELNEEIWYETEQLTVRHG